MRLHVQVDQEQNAAASDALLAGTDALATAVWRMAGGFCRRARKTGVRSEDVFLNNFRGLVSVR